MPPARVTREQFRSMDWLIGRWIGSGGNYPVFYEEYRFQDDSTIIQRSFADSTFSAATDSSFLAWRNFIVMSGNPPGEYIATAFRNRDLRFVRQGAAFAGYGFYNVVGDQWTAAIYPENRQAEPTRYTMRRVRESIPDGINRIIAAAPGFRSLRGSMIQRKDDYIMYETNVHLVGFDGCALFDYRQFTDSVDCTSLKGWEWGSLVGVVQGLLGPPYEEEGERATWRENNVDVTVNVSDGGFVHLSVRAK